MILSRLFRRATFSGLAGRSLGGWRRLLGNLKVIFGVTIFALILNFMPKKQLNIELSLYRFASMPPFFVPITIAPFSPSFFSSLPQTASPDPDSASKYS